MSVNLQSKTLIENWVEERQVASLEAGNRQEDGTLTTSLHRQGHKGILTTDLSSSMQKTSTVEETFKSPEGPRVRMTGSRREALQKALYEMVSKEVENELHPPPPPAELVSTTKHDFSREFEPMDLPPTKHHDLYKEDPATYWKNNMGSVMGVSKMASRDKPFHKNTHFSTPIKHQMSQSVVDETN